MLTENHIKELWRRMVAIYGHRWVSSFGEKDENGTWLIGLQDLTPNLLAIGVESCIKHRQDSWPPTLPEFRRICLGLPDVEIACLDALRGKNDRISQAIRKKIGSWDMSHGSEKDLLRMARAHYETACQEATSAKLLELTHAP